MTTDKRLQPANCIISAAGIDWLTLTSTSKQSMQRMFRAFSQEVAADRKRGYAPKPGGHHGFFGHKVEHALYATREDRAMLVLSSDAARTHVVAPRRGDNCTRLDVQATVRIGEENIPAFLGEQEEMIPSRRTLRGQAPDVTLERRNGRAYQLKVGSRKSEIYIRLYDKFLESKEERYRGCLRFEVEYKGKASQALWEHMADTGDGVRWLLSIMLSTLAERGIDVSMIDLDRQDVVRPKTPTLKEDRTRGWWWHQVAPGVARAVAERGWEEAFHILFHLCLTEYDKHVIMRRASLAWGN